MPTVEKTNAMRVLDSAHVSYQVFTFSEEIHSADGVARALGIPPERVFKTLVVIPGNGKPILAIVPGHKELDLKLLAQLIGEKKIRMATQAEAESLTGLQVGGISALALIHKGFRVLIDRSCQQHEQILVSAGRRGINLELAPADLIRVVNARVAEIT